MPTDSQEDSIANMLPPYALVIAEVIDRQGGDVLIRVTDPDGTSKDVWIDDSNVAPLREEEAARVAEQWKIALPG